MVCSKDSCSVCSRLALTSELKDDVSRYDTGRAVNVIDSVPRNEVLEGSNESLTVSADTSGDEG